MSRSEISSFEGYIGKVFDFAGNLGLLSDGRQYPTKSISSIFLVCFYGTCFRLKAVSAIAEESREGCLSQRVGSISDDTIGYGLNHLDVASVQEFWNVLSKRAKRNGMLRGGEFDDYIVGVLDCIETYSSNKRHCPRCLTRKVTTSKGKVVQYYHRMVVLTLVGYDFPIPIGLEMVKPREGEVKCALRLLKRLVGRLGKRFLDIVIGDAAYCTPYFFKSCEKMGIVPGAVLKENQSDLLQTAMAEKKQLPPKVQEENKKEKLKVWDLPQVIWDTADREVRVIYADRKVKKKTAIKPIEDDASKSGDGAEEEWSDKKRVFAFSKRIDHLSPQLLYKIGIHRWDIDADLFMDMTKHWHLKHKTLHFEKALENLLSIRFISHMVFMFFFYRHINARRAKENQIKSPLKMARRLYRAACQNLYPEVILLE